ncbi:hypothetical protein KDA_74090 [Dictyobacter alpinus]|uniref:Uncharacterized protein n=1 Tax=Dictyobacter alpinus TaxID=2014873 RepID=A0A402BKP4_9CHLR|nr:hypothetical protein KDA_74090 [Dictyobacter alpinus]
MARLAFICSANEFYICSECENNQAEITKVVPEPDMCQTTLKTCLATLITNVGRMVSQALTAWHLSIIMSEQSFIMNDHSLT